MVLRSASGHLLAVESKFCEPFSQKTQSLQDKYFPEGEDRWRAAGMNGVQEAASMLRSRNPFTFVDAAQLLKHMLGLAHGRADWHLLLLWMVPNEDVAPAMTAEASKFKDMLGDDGQRFSWLSYQELWSRLRPLLSTADGQYGDYLTQRYFPSVPISAGK